MADRITIDAFDRLGIKAEQLRHLTEAMVELESMGDDMAAGRLASLAADLAAEVCRLIEEAGQAGARALMSSD